MKQLQQWVMQVRYPYAAGIIAVMWIGTAIFAYLKPRQKPAPSKSSDPSTGGDCAPPA
jgi:hypothetical protein